MRRNETANTLQARTTCESMPEIGGAVEDPTDDLVEQFLNKVSDRLPKEPGTPISKNPVNVTLQGKLCKI